MLRLESNYRKALRVSDILLLDGVGMQILVRMALGKNVFNNNGTDLLPRVLENCRAENKSVYFYGATNIVNDICIQKARADGLKASGQDGYSALDLAEIPDYSYLFVALGTPKQELWLYRNREVIKQKRIVAIGVGGFLDFYSGAAKRAPILIRKLRLEFFYRFLSNPSQHKNKIKNNLLIFREVIRLRNWKKENK